MKTQRKFSKAVLLSLAGGLIGALSFAVVPAHAQTAVAAPVATTSTQTIQVSGTASSVKTGLPETVKFAGPLVVTSTVVTDPLMPPSVVVQINGLAVKGTGNKGGTYSNELEANLTRPFGGTDTINTTFAFYKDGSDVITSKTGLLTLTLTYDTATNTLTAASASIATL